jgi:hypothetical protein
MHFYAITRRDLDPAQQAIQAAHAQVEFARVHPDSLAQDHPPFVWLSAENKWELLQLSCVLRSYGLSVVEFHDPDYKGFDPSALACLVDEDHRYLLSEFPLWVPLRATPVAIKGQTVASHFFSLLREGSLENHAEG